MISLKTAIKTNANTLVDVHKHSDIRINVHQHSESHPLSTK